MEPYLLQGIIRPERAHLSFSLSLPFTYSFYPGLHTAIVSVSFNQVSVWVDTEASWDIYDLRNLVKDIVQDQLAIIGYMLGYAYDLEITRVLSREREIDFIFGIDIPCLAARNQGQDISTKLALMHQKCIGENGAFLRRCLNDLTSAMKHPVDTGFYCYRALESLRHHCAAMHSLTGSSKDKQWAKFREITGVSQESVMLIKRSADFTRHGEPIDVTGEERAKLFTVTWDIVDAYLAQVIAHSVETVG